MLTLTDQNIADIKILHQEAISKLTKALGNNDGQTLGELTDPYAPCLIAHSIGDIIGILNIINKASGK